MPDDESLLDPEMIEDRGAVAGVSVESVGGSGIATFDAVIPWIPRTTGPELPQRATVSSPSPVSTLNVSGCNQSGISDLQS
jgi:hypothetical protein